MLKPPQTNALIKDCWQQLLQLHKSLAELEMLDTQRWEFFDPESWRKRAEEARVLASTSAEAQAKYSLLDIADAYDTLANPTRGFRG
jgi:hypothetical protein